MYLLATHIPIYLSGDRAFVDDSWFNDIELARRYFAPHIGKLHVIGPKLPLPEAGSHMLLHEVPLDSGDLALHPSVDGGLRIRQYWPQGFRQWKRDLTLLVQQATVVHASIDDPFRPMQLAALIAGLRAKKTTVLIGFDMDVWDVMPAQFAHMGRAAGALHVLRTMGMDAAMRYCVRRASVAMLKEGKVHDRYASMALNPRSFCHSMHTTAQVMAADELEGRLASLVQGRPLRLGYFGRFVERKGLTDTLRIVKAALARGVNLSLSLIGSGPQQAALEGLVRELGITDHVRFCGFLPYGDALHLELRKLDALLFTPTEEDTPRMVYDAYASGLPLVTSDIPFLQRRASVDGASVLFGVGAIDAGADAIAGLNRERKRLAALSRIAHARGKYHTVENWYQRRLEWTLEAIQAHTQRTRRASFGDSPVP